MNVKSVSPLRTRDARPFAWYRTLGTRGRRAFFGAFGGYGLDSYDFQVLSLGVGAIIAYFGISTGAAGLLTTVTLVVSAIGGALAGIRRYVVDADSATEGRRTSPAKGSFPAIFRGDLLRTTLFASLLATGVQGGYYTLATWLPQYLKVLGLPETRGRQLAGPQVSTS